MGQKTLIFWWKTKQGCNFGSVFLTKFEQIWVTILTDQIVAQMPGNYYKYLEGAYMTIWPYIQYTFDGILFLRKPLYSW